MNDVAIIGVGLHPFGRFEGKSAMEMGVDAIFAAVADAGVEWKDVQFATGGSWTVANPDAIVGMVGLSGIPFTNVFNACATAASAAKACADGIRLGDYDIGIAVGLDKHPRGAFTEDPALVGMPSLVRRERPVPDHSVLRHEGQPLSARPRHLAGDAGQGRRQELPQRRAEPECVPAQADRAKKTSSTRRCSTIP